MKTYVTVDDVMQLIGCKKTAAYKAIKEINRYAETKNLLVFGQGRANKYLFSERYGIPIADIDRAIEGN